MNGKNPKLAKGANRIRILRKKIRNMEKRGIGDGVRFQRLVNYRSELQHVFGLAQ